MKRVLILIQLLALTLYNCGVSPKSTSASDLNSINDSLVIKFANTITAFELKEALYAYASDEFEGRRTGQPGQKKAVEYLKNFYVSQGISALLDDNDYFQEVPKTYLGKGLEDSENVLAYIEGSEKPNEFIVISAHLDHEGIKNGDIYNGADDDGSGTVSILEIAEAFKKAVNDGYRPKRSILFLHVTAEEEGLLGSQYFTDVDPVVPLKNIVANLNIDMIGRRDIKHNEDGNYIYLIGSNKLSAELHQLSEDINTKYVGLELDYTYNSVSDPNRYFYRSDHYNFAKHNIPVIFYFSGNHADYHKPTDTPEKIEYDLLEKRTKLIFYTAWELATRENRITIGL
ncbi:M28 family metallopeptidase [Yeosuana sp. MJ-SS3]|uniref:M28 family metallopeptidase n=1 Tax=Gilvirhabdus luticola TaxID=3079858 RepID=A0ABU3U7F0_9FLAO|nr:M28 family metallopeptidase [Yeosuana sp. MJ-SS3]MDU8886343.1 M28 family metallopeptidase [Yeosuana sp. MJ-SS3]